VNIDELRSAIRTSGLCGTDEELDAAPVDELAELYNVELRVIADRLTPEHSVTVRRQASDPWFDDECSTEKHSLRATERLARRSQSAADIAQ